MVSIDKVVAELKEKRTTLPPPVDSKMAHNLTFTDTSQTVAKASSDPETEVTSSVEDAIEALTGLGYGRAEAFDAVHTINNESPDADVSALITGALKYLSS